MRNNTQRIYERLGRGEFLSVDSADTSTRHLYEDIEENVEDYTDFLKCYNQSFAAGYQFRKSHLIEQISLDIELKEKANHLFKKYGVGSNMEIINKLLQEMQTMGFAECISEQDETYKITSAFRYVEELVNIIQIANEDEVPE